MHPKSTIPKGIGTQFQCYCQLLTGSALIRLEKIILGLTNLSTLALGASSSQTFGYLQQQRKHNYKICKIYYKVSNGTLCHKNILEDAKSLSFFLKIESYAPNNLNKASESLH